MIFAVLASICAGAFGGDLAEKERPEAKRLYTAKCAKCHRFYDPKEYGDDKWEHWMGKMKKKARLNDEQYRLVRAYTYELKKGE